MAIGVFIFASGLILLCGITGLFARLMVHIPPRISAAMLAGILLRFGLDTFVSLQSHFTDTARHLAISQPALSSALRQIETVLAAS